MIADSPEAQVLIRPERGHRRPFGPFYEDDEIYEQDEDDQPEEREIVAADAGQPECPERAQGDEHRDDRHLVRDVERAEREACEQRRRDGRTRGTPAEQREEDRERSGDEDARVLQAVLIVDLCIETVQMGDRGARRSPRHTATRLAESRRRDLHDRDEPGDARGARGE